MVPIIDTIAAIREKIERDARAIRSVEARNDYLGRNKIIVFSEFLSALDLVEIGVDEWIQEKCLRFDGRCSVEQRELVRKLFEEEGKDFTTDQPHEARILLATSQAAAEGLTLVHASHVVFLAPCWNPYVELQAVHRAARIGQLGRVLVHRFICEHSVEQRVVDVSDVKLDKVDSLQDEARLLDKVEKISKWTEQRFRMVLESGSGQAVKAGITWG